ncbi:MAG TPA: hypothetical protein VJ725_14450 [Thermoanaerobaculia bacterium]|nr:hypothetical protein [Thermoanaerobaculia bacterium]
MEPASTAPSWGPAKRLFFRFAFCYLILYIFPFPLDFIPGPFFEDLPVKIWDPLVVQAGRHLFGTEITVRPNGSGDTTWNYVQVFCIFALALVSAAVWTLLDRKRRDYTRLQQGLLAFVRLRLAAAMVQYGAYKVIQAQFPGPVFADLLQTFGGSSPMGLLWRFMGASKAYNVFTGAAEMLGGLLLIARRTTLLGALVCIGVMSNVFLLNMCYDVPVKLYSFHLLAMAVFLALPGLRRLADVFLWNREAEPVRPQPLFPGRLHGTALALRTVLILGITGLTLSAAYEGATKYGDLAPRPPLYGLWEVDELEMDGKVLPPLITDPVRWRRVMFEAPEILSLHLMDDSKDDAQRYYRLVLDPQKRTLQLTGFRDKKPVSALAYHQPAPGLLALEGTYDGHKVKAKLRRADDSRFLLKTRGFHWINEYPFNR